jgi:hypothetical protein
MRLIKRLVEVALIVLMVSLFALNTDQSVQIKYYGLPQPITVQFWELVLFCVAFGIIIAAFGDFITQLKWLSERRRMIKTDREHQADVQTLSDKIRGLEAENGRVQRELEHKSKECEDNSGKLEQKSLELEQMAQELDTKTRELAAAKAKEPVDAEDPFAEPKVRSGATEHDERA